MKTQPISYHEVHIGKCQVERVRRLQIVALNRSIHQNVLENANVMGSWYEQGWRYSILHSVYI